MVANQEEESQEEEVNYEFIKRIKETSPSALKLFLILSWKGREGEFCYTDRLAVQDTGMSLWTVQRAKKELIEKGMIEYRPSKKRGVPSVFKCKISLV